MSAGTSRVDRESGQVVPLLVGGLAFLLVAAAVLAAIASGLTGRGDQQRAADLAALAAARSMAAGHSHLFAPEAVGGRDNPAHRGRGEYLERAREAAEAVARHNGIDSVAVSFPGADPVAPMRVRVTVLDPLGVGGGIEAGIRAEAELTIGPGALTGGDLPGEYSGPLAVRQGKPMRPDVAAAFDRMSVAARRDGQELLVVSGYRSDAEQAVLFAAHPDPKWVAPPGKSLHRLGTELDLGPKAAYGWLAANAMRFHFVQRYSWEAWHYGFVLNAGTTSLGYKADGRSTLPSFVPEQYAPALTRAARRWNVSAALLAAQLYAESGFNPMAVSSMGARGIAQFIPSTARAYGLTDPFDAAAGIDAQGHLMHDLMRQFGSVPLALAAYNAGPGRVTPCMCVPPIAETQAYVARILALLGGAGIGAFASGPMEVRLVA